MSNTIFNVKQKITLNYPKSAAMGFCYKRLKNEFETTVINEPSVFYCTYRKVFAPFLHFKVFDYTIMFFPVISTYVKHFCDSGTKPF